MKAIYINLDPYLAAFAAWLKGGKVGTKPDFQPLPLAVTIPLGETAAIFLPSAGSSYDDIAANSATIDGQTVYFCVAPEGTLPEDSIAFEAVPGLSTLAPSAKYTVAPWTSWETDNGATVPIYIGETDSAVRTFAITVLVRREQPSGPVDLVDFTPPAAAPTAADIKSALVAAGDGALAGVRLGGAILLAPSSSQTSTDATFVDNGASHALEYLDPSDAQKVLGSTSNS